MHKDKMRPLWAEINLDHLAENVRNIKALVGDSRLIAIVKADAYGHGATDVAKTISENGAEGFGVAVVTEALELRHSGVQEPIMVLSYTPESYFEEAIQADLVLNCLCYEDAKRLHEVAKSLGKKAKVLISLDTGISRVGFLPTQEGLKDVVAMNALSHIELDSIYTHFASADEGDKTFTEEQIQRYQAAMAYLKEQGVHFTHQHVANSAAIVDLPETYLESVRPGIILYGYHPSWEVKKHRLPLKPVMSLKGQIIQLKTHKKGTGISYGHKFVTTREETRIATIPIGYADGYFRNLSNKAKVIVHGQLCPQVGAICMDHMMVDVTDVEGVERLDVVTIMGEEGETSFTADDLANILGTISYEITCAVSKRVPRIYLKNGQEVSRKTYV